VSPFAPRAAGVTLFLVNGKDVAQDTYLADSMPSHGRMSMETMRADRQGLPATRAATEYLQ
jgi:hypothetical protein